MWRPNSKLILLAFPLEMFAMTSPLAMESTLIKHLMQMMMIALANWSQSERIWNEMQPVKLIPVHGRSWLTGELVERRWNRMQRRSWSVV